VTHESVERQRRHDERQRGGQAGGDLARPEQASGSHRPQQVVKRRIAVCWNGMDQVFDAGKRTRCGK